MKWMDRVAYVGVAVLLALFFYVAILGAPSRKKVLCKVDLKLDKPVTFEDGELIVALKSAWEGIKDGRINRDLENVVSYAVTKVSLKLNKDVPITNVDLWLVNDNDTASAAYNSKRDLILIYQSSLSDFLSFWRVLLHESLHLVEDDDESNIKGTLQWYDEEYNAEMVSIYLFIETIGDFPNDVMNEMGKYDKPYFIKRIKDRYLMHYQNVKKESNNFYEDYKASVWAFDETEPYALSRLTYCHCWETGVVPQLKMSED